MSLNHNSIGAECGSALTQEAVFRRFDNNLKAFKEHASYLCPLLENYKVKRQFELVQAEDLSLNLRFLDDGSLFYTANTPYKTCSEQLDYLTQSLVYDDLEYSHIDDNFGQIHHRYANEAIAYLKEHAQSLMVQDLYAMPHCVLFGCALGYMPLMLLERFDIRSLVIVENNIDIFYASLFTIDYASIFLHMQKNNAQLHFIINADVHKAFRELYTFYNDYGFFLSAFKCVIATGINNDIKLLIDSLYNSSSNLLSSAGFFDDLLFGYSHGIACINKQSSLIRNDVCLKGDIASLKIFVIGNGPSLEKDIAFIRANQDKALIVACGTALESLYNLGVKADFYVVTERPDYTAAMLDIFKGTNYLDDIVLLSANMLHPDNLDYFEHKLIFVKEDEGLGTVLKADEGLLRIFDNWAGVNYINPLVGNAALACILKLGFKQIYLFGLDNGSRTQTQNHASSSKIYNGSYKINKLKRYDAPLMAEGNFGGQIFSNSLYITSKENMQRSLSLHAEALCINCSDGILIDGALGRHSSDLDFTDESVIDKKAVIEQILSDMSFKAHIDESDLNRVFDKNKFNQLCDTIITLLDTKAASRNELFYVISRISEFLGRMSLGSDALYAIVLNGSSQFFFYMATKALYKVKNEQEALEHSGKVIGIYKNFLQDCKYLFSFMPNYIENEHLKLTGNKIGLDHDGSAAPRNFRAFKLFNGPVEPLDKAFVKRYE